MANMSERISAAAPIPQDFTSPEGLSPVAAYASAEEAGEAGLALLAMGEAYWTLLHGDRYVLCVYAGVRDAARRELEEVERLRNARPAVVERGGPDFREFRCGPFSFAVYALLLLGFFALQGWIGIAVAEAGRIDAGAVIGQAELWRLVTALTLHTDVVHLVSNLVAGIGFGIFVARFFGAAPGWLLILASGAGGNWLNAWVRHPEAHFSVGASTAVFGALGILTGIGLWGALREPKWKLTFPRWLVPVLGGLTLLGMLGVGGERGARVDVGAHISGFGVGAVFGIAGAARQGIFVRLQRWRRTVGMIAGLLVLAAWWTAWSHI